MFGALPDRISPDQLLAAGGRAQGFVPLAGLKRLAGVLRGEQAGAADADLELMLDAERRYWLQGRIGAELVLHCERCLSLMPWPVETAVGIFLPRSEAEATGLPADAEYTVMADPFRLYDLIEDELILALPLVAKHPAGTDCGDRALRGPVAESGARENPFAILRKMKI